jgi:hypothetical protein
MPNFTKQIDMAGKIRGYSKEVLVRNEKALRKIWKVKLRGQND